MRFSQAYLNTLVAKDKLSYMIALYPSDKTIKELVKIQGMVEFPKGEEVAKPKEFHCTLRYWRAEDHPEAPLFKVQENDPFDEVIKISNKIHFEILGKDNALVIVLNDSDLVSKQKILDKVLKDAGVPPSDYNSFKAHITLGYGLEQVPDVLPKTANIPIELVRIALTENSGKVLYTKDLK